MKIWTHSYELKSLHSNFKSRTGVLLKVEWALNQIGYSDLHPWPEFGEEPLDTHLEKLSRFEFTKLSEISLEFNFIDRELRHLRRNAFAGLIIPRSHRLIEDLPSVRFESLKEWQQQGFTHVKAKVGRDLKSELRALKDLIPATPFQWRLDFNGRLEAAEFTSWWSEIPEDLKRRIDFVEDPVSHEKLGLHGPWADDWRRLPGASVRVIKPTRETVDDVSAYARIVFTHSLDHPLGQVCAAWTASKYYWLHPKRTEVCGLGMNEIYEPNGFSKLWPSQGPRLKPTPGFGLGFDEILESIAWQRLV